MTRFRIRQIDGATTAADVTFKFLGRVKCVIYTRPLGFQTPQSSLTFI